MNIIFDGNGHFHKIFNVWSTYYRGQDLGEVLRDKENRQVLIRKCVIDMCAILRRFPEITNVVFVFDKRSWRYSIHDDYKYALTRVADEWKDEFISALWEFADLLEKKGVIVSKVQGAEGDDLLYIWSIYFDQVLDEQCCIVTSDSDIRQIITGNVSLFNSNSKRLACHCLKHRKAFWHDYFDVDVPVVTVEPFEVVLQKVILGDGNDNIPKLKRGFGDKAFEKFLAHITPYDVPGPEYDLVSLGQWIASRWCEFTKTDEVEELGKILFNLKLAWLNLATYNIIDYPTENGRSLLENMLDDVAAKQDGYSYNKPYTLEDFYGMRIK